MNKTNFSLVKHNIICYQISLLIITHIHKAPQLHRQNYPELSRGITISGRWGPLQDGKRSYWCHGRLLSGPFPRSRSREGNNQHKIAETWFRGDNRTGESSNSLQRSLKDFRKAEY